MDSASKPDGVCARLLALSSLWLVVGLMVLAGCRTPPFTDDAASNAPAKGLTRLPAAEAQASETSKDTDKTRCDILLAMAMNHEHHDQLAAAITTYERILRIDAHHAAALHRIALAHDREGNHDRATEYFDRCINVVGEHSELLADLGYRAYLQDDWQAAEEFFQRGLATGDASARLHNNYALLLTRLERYPEAIEEFRAGGCSRDKAYSNVGHLCVMEQRWDKAHEYLSIATDHRDGCPVARVTMQHLWPEGFDRQPVPQDHALVAFETGPIQRGQ